MKIAPQNAGWNAFFTREVQETWYAEAAGTDVNKCPTINGVCAGGTRIRTQNKGGGGNISLNR